LVFVEILKQLLNYFFLEKEKKRLSLVKKKNEK